VVLAPYLWQIQRLEHIVVGLMYLRPLLSSVFQMEFIEKSIFRCQVEAHKVNFIQVEPAAYKGHRK
jgi:hypothetical protein